MAASEEKTSVVYPRLVSWVLRVETKEFPVGDIPTTMPGLQPVFVPLNCFRIKVLLLASAVDFCPYIVAVYAGLEIKDCSS